VLLDSPQSGNTPARYSYLAADPFMVVRSKDQQVSVEKRGKISVLEGSPFDVLRDLLGRYRTAPVAGLPPFQGGAIGYLAYELAHHLELLPGAAENNLGLPELNIAFYDWVVARDETTGETWAIATGLPDGGEAGAGGGSGISSRQAFLAEGGGGGRCVWRGRRRQPTVGRPRLLTSCAKRSAREERRRPPRARTQARDGQRQRTR
jgi:anthranilate/para-aminobenzoate synthase component I